MNGLVVQLRLRRGLRLACNVLLTSLISMPIQLLAAQPQELRLFHEPLSNVVSDEQLISLNQSQAMQSELQQPKSQQGDLESEIKLPNPDMPPADKTDEGGITAYQYNGFISTASGRYYLINGLPLSGIDSLILVSVKLGGRSLVLKTPKGHSFELSIGQSISQDSL